MCDYEYVAIQCTIYYSMMRKNDVRTIPYELNIRSQWSVFILEIIQIFCSSWLDVVHFLGCFFGKNYHENEYQHFLVEK